MIIFDNVTVTLSSGRVRTVILNDVSITLPTNEHLAVFGRQGSGKTTLIRLLAGAIMPSSGTVMRYGRVSFPVGFTGGFKRTLSVRENIAHAAHLYGADADEVVTFVAEVAGIREELRETFGNLPQQQRIRMAYALSYAIPFDTYLIDNKIAMGDDDFRAKCENVFAQRMTYSGFILTSNVPRYAKRFATRAAILTNRSITLYDDIDRAIWDFQRLLPSLPTTEEEVAEG